MLKNYLDILLLKMKRAIFGCIYEGELRDARCGQEGSDKPGFDQAGWEKAVVCSEDSPGLISHRMPPVKVNEVFVPLGYDGNSHVYILESGSYNFFNRK